MKKEKGVQQRTCPTVCLSFTGLCKPRSLHRYQEIPVLDEVLSIRGEGAGEVLEPLKGQEKEYLGMDIKELNERRGK